METYPWSLSKAFCVKDQMTVVGPNGGHVAIRSVALIFTLQVIYKEFG